MNMKRYCETILQEIKPCNVGWGTGYEHITATCKDEPKEQNCQNLIDIDSLLCPVCGNKLVKKEM